MNDNLRNISLQYIKGENYEKITCFHSDDIAKIQKILSEPSYIKENYKLLEDILKIEKRDIGESLLDDLINYISLQSLKEPIKDGINKKEKSIKDKKKNAIDANNDSSKKRKKLKELISDLKQKITVVENDTDTSLTYNSLIPKWRELTILISTTLDKLKKTYNITDKDCTDNEGTTIENLIKLINESTNESINEDDYIKKYICKEISKYIETNKNFTTGIKKYNIKFAEKVLIFLTILMNLEKEINEGEKATNKSSIDNLEKLIKIFKKYLYICENNIKKYEKIFDHNEIGNIDEAFMIESYSKFLKKLYKLKQNLETKDTKKIKRELINSLDQFFNLHGFNNPEKIENKAEIDYIVQRILNYT